jgi:hypothetical protein
MWSVDPALVAASSATESAITAETAAAASAATPALLGVTPIGADPDSVMLAEALNACGAGYLGVVSEHVAQRGLFAGAQGMASAVYETTEAFRAAAIGLGG